MNSFSKNNKSNKSILSVKLTMETEASGLITDINQSQLDSLYRFKESILETNMLEDFSDYDNAYLLRFLRARNFDCDKALLMFDNYLKWRVTKRVDYLMRVDPPINKIIKVLYPLGYHKTDKLGRPIFLNFLCDINLDKMIQDIDDQDVENFQIKLFETFNANRLPMCSKAKGEIIEQGLTILNARDLGISFTKKSLKYIKMTSNLTQNYFPETLGKMYVINASSLFYLIWSIVKPFVDEKTRKKIFVFKNDYLEKLLEDVDRENLPKMLGGDCECEEGCLNSDKGPWNP